MATNDGYAAEELQRVLDRGPHPGNDSFRLKVTGDGESHWVNVSDEQLALIVRVLKGQP